MKRELLTLREYLGSPPVFWKVSCYSSFKFSVLCFFSSVSCAKFYLCLLILHSGLILRLNPKVCYLDNLTKNIIVQIRYHDNDNYKTDLILNLGAKEIARHSKIILNLYKRPKITRLRQKRINVKKNNENKRSGIQNS